MQPQTPGNIRLFEKLNIAALVIGIGVAALTFDAYRAQASAAFILTIQGIVFALCFALIFWISRGRSNIGKWIWTILMIIGFVFYIPALAGMLELGLPGILSIVQLVLEVVGLYLLFTPASRRWFAGRTQQDQSQGPSQGRVEPRF